MRKEIPQKLNTREGNSSSITIDKSNISMKNNSPRLPQPLSFNHSNINLQLNNFQLGSLKLHQSKNNSKKRTRVDITNSNNTYATHENEEGDGENFYNEENSFYSKFKFINFENYDCNYFDTDFGNKNNQKLTLSKENLELKLENSPHFYNKNTPLNQSLNLSNPSTIFTFKNDTNNSTINKILPINSYNSNNDIKSITNFFPCKKNVNNTLSKDREIKEKKDSIFKIDKIDIEKLLEEDVELQNFILENSMDTKTTNNYDNSIDDNIVSVYSFPLNKIIKHEKLNPVQEKCFDLLVNSDLNSVITSPTGSGKTTLFELAICRLLKKFYNKEFNKIVNTNFKIVYLAPIKSLCQEKFFDWKIKFSEAPFSLSVIEATGDSEYLNMAHLMNSNIILCTPERWDIITRKWKEYPQFISNICLFLIDEVHLLNEEQRGATLEAIIARMKLISALPQFSTSLIRYYRTIALSATIPNLSEIAELLSVDFEKGMKNFGEEYRPIKIEKLVFGYNNEKNEYMFEKYLNYRLADLILKFSDNRPSLVFCQTQKGTINAANQLQEDISKLNNTNSNGNSFFIDKSSLVNVSTRIKDKTLSNLVKNGIAFHNAGVSGEDRQIVEDYFKKGLIKIICTTSTLAQGVNLPARLVIIKSTYCYRGPKVGYNEYSKMEIDQMIGRAGRPQYDTKGIAIILTEKSNVDKYVDLTTENLCIESHLKDNIIEHINAEINQGTIVDVESAVKWLKNTFMYIRMKNNPQKFNIKIKFKTDTVTIIDEYLRKLCLNIFDDLKKIDLIAITNEANKIKNDNNPNSKAEGTSLGRKMCKNYVYFETLKNISKINSNTEESILDVLSYSYEFSKYHSKMEDRKVLNHLNKDDKTIKYKLKGTIDTSNKKVFLLLQSALSGINIDQWELRRQQNEIVNSSTRILNCIKEFYKIKNDGRGYINSIILMKCLTRRMWSDSDMIMKQLPKIGEKTSKFFVKAGLTTFEKVMKENPRKLESICGKNTPFGNIIIDILRSIPVIEFKYEILKNYKNTFKLAMTFNLPWRKYIHQEDFDPYTNYHAVVIDSKTNKILFKKKLKPTSNTKNLLFNIPSVSIDNFPLNIYLICDKFLGFDKSYIILNSEDKCGQLSNNVTCNGQITLYQMYDKIARNNSIKTSLIDEQIQDIIHNEFDNSDFAKEKNNSNKSINKKKKIKNNTNDKYQNENLKMLIDNMRNNSSSDIKIKKEDIDPNLQTAIKVSNDIKSDFIKNYDDTVIKSINKFINNDVNRDEFPCNLDFLDNYQNIHQDKNGNTKINKPKNRFSLNFDDIL